MKNLFKLLPKKALTAVIVAGTVLGVTVLGAVSAANSNLMEGNTQSLNVTRGQTQYQDTTNASDGEVVQVQVWLHNRENPAGEQANNTTVKIAVPQNQPGANQNITGTITSDNFNTVSDTTTVALDDATSSIEFIPGTAKYRYNKGAAEGDQTCETGFDNAPARCFETVQISDSVISGGVNLQTVRKTPLRGCNAHHETVTIQVRVKNNKKPSYSVQKTARLKGESREDWRESVVATPGQHVEWKVEFKNNGNTQLKDVIILDQVPAGLKAIPGTVKLFNTSNPNGFTYPDNAVQADGSQVNVNVGTYNPGSNAIVTFETKMPKVEELKCGTNKFVNIAYATPKDSGTVNDGAEAKVSKECEESKIPVCKVLNLTKLGDRKIRAEVSFEANGAVLKDVTFNFGDGTAPLVTDKTTVEHTYAANGTYAVSASGRFMVDGKEQVVSGDDCTKSVTFEEVPQVLPSTGAGGLIGLVSLTTIAGGLAHNFVARRRLNG